MANTTVLHHATVLKSKSEETIKKEVALKSSYGISRNKGGGLFMVG